MQDLNLNNAQNIYKEADGARGALIGIIHFQLILSKVQCYLLFGVCKFRILFLLLELPETIRSFSNPKILTLSFKTSVFIKNPVTHIHILTKKLVFY